MTDFDAARSNMVDCQIRTNKVTDERLVAALRSVPRHLFVPLSRRMLAYIDEPLAIANGRSLPTPMVAARLYQLAEIGPDDLVLVVGAASGYGAAVVGQLASAVVALEEDPDLAAMARDLLEGGTSDEVSGDNIILAEGPLADGWTKQAPYDVIILEGAVETVPQALIDQLAPGGRLVAVQREGSNPGDAIIMLRESNGVATRSAFDAVLPILPGFTKEQEFAL